MCLAIIKTRKGKILKDDMERAFRANSCGGGFAIANGTCIDVVKGFFSFKDMWEVLEPALALKRPMLIHFRLATHGARTEENCHPFKFTAQGVEYALIHNGIISGFGTSGWGVNVESRSDSKEFTETVVNPLYEAARDPMAASVTRIIEKVASFGNKIAIMRQDGLVVRTQADDWHRVSKVWYSNRSYLEMRKVHSYVYDGEEGTGFWSQKSRASLPYWGGGQQQKSTVQAVQVPTSPYVSEGRVESTVEDECGEDEMETHYQSVREDVIDAELSRLTPHDQDDVLMYVEQLTTNGYRADEAWDAALEMVKSRK
jgi:hypothetical protein